MKSKIILAAVVLIMGCSSDYSVEDSMTQTIPAANIKFLIIECTCTDSVRIKEGKNDVIVAKITGEESSVGYHGDQTTPDEIGETMLSFKTRINADTLRLISKEWAHIHHSFLIEELELEIPRGLPYKLVKVTWEELNDRKVN
jgi:hypothetical protein